LLKLFADAGVPCAPINTYSQVLQDPQVKHMEWVRPLQLPSGSETVTFVSPIKMRGERFGVYRRPPALGEHTREILAELGVGAESHM
jgi:formyl-CoA transferase